MLERLQKIIARAGIASRRHAEELIRSGQVRVNGEVVTELGAKADPEHDRVEAAGQVAERPEQPSYYLLNKPAHVVSTMSDPEGRATLRHLLRGLAGGVFPVGRLDYAASGLVLLTSDGELADRIFKNSARMPQVYWIKVKGRLRDETLQQVRSQAHAHLRLLQLPGSAPPESSNPWYEVEMAEARRDLLRNALFALGHPVEKMKRVKLGPLDLGDLPEANYRSLAPSEVSQLRRSIEIAAKAPRTPVSKQTRRFRGRWAAQQASSDTNSAPPPTMAPPQNRPQAFRPGEFIHGEADRPMGRDAQGPLSGNRFRGGQKAYGDAPPRRDAPPGRPTGRDAQGPPSGNRFRGGQKPYGDAPPRRDGPPGRPMGRDAQGPPSGQRFRGGQKPYGDAPPRRNGPPGRPMGRDAQGPPSGQRFRGGQQPYGDAPPRRDGPPGRPMGRDAQGPPSGQRFRGGQKPYGDAPPRRDGPPGRPMGRDAQGPPSGNRFRGGQKPYGDAPPRRDGPPGRPMGRDAQGPPSGNRFRGGQKPYGDAPPRRDGPPGRPMGRDAQGPSTGNRFRGGQKPYGNAPPRKNGPAGGGRPGRGTPGRVPPKRGQR